MSKLLKVGQYLFLLFLVVSFAIGWQSSNTGHKHHGKAIFKSEQAAQHVANDLNIRFNYGGTYYYVLRKRLFWYVRADRKAVTGSDAIVKKHWNKLNKESR
ncbi:MAG: hypothetical protein KGI50_06155 [Patescibacteria group bacterium]|nr:hypothetical protein [Patescibacteria group bacterium]MDE2438981.1 hypothetical protein [Patescibacteria group bacterium]